MLIYFVGWGEEWGLVVGEEGWKSEWGWRVGGYLSVLFCFFVNLGDCFWCGFILV